MKANLIDLYRFMVHPIVLGTGPKPFAEGAARRELVLATSRSLPRGIVILEYRPAA